MKFIDDCFLLNDKSKYQPIEGLRALAVIMVFNVHFFNQFYQKNFFFAKNSIGELLARTLHAGHLGVDVFFVISGFLIYRNLFLKRTPPVAFLKHRVQRLFPSHVLVLLILAHSAFDLTKFVSDVFFLPGFIRSHFSYNYVTWSLGWEWLFYIALLAIGLLSGYRTRVAFLLMSGFLAVNLVLQLTWTDVKVVFPDTFRFSSFFLGCAVAAIRNRRTVRLSGILMNVVALAALLGLFICSAVWSLHAEKMQASGLLRSSFYSFVGVTSAILLYALLSGESFMSKLFSLKILRSIGQMSYSFYLTHTLIGIPFSRRFTGQVNSVAGMVGAYFISIFVTGIISSFVYYYTERDYFLKRKTAPAGINRATS